jgi:hypothetical protein
MSQGPKPSAVVYDGAGFQLVTFVGDKERLPMGSRPEQRHHGAADRVEQRYCAVVAQYPGTMLGLGDPRDRQIECRIECQIKCQTADAQTAASSREQTHSTHQ